MDQSLDYIGSRPSSSYMWVNRGRIKGYRRIGHIGSQKHRFQCLIFMQQFGDVWGLEGSGSTWIGWFYDACSKMVSVLLSSLDFSFFRFRRVSFEASRIDHQWMSFCDWMPQLMALQPRLYTCGSTLNPIWIGNEHKRWKCFPANQTPTSSFHSIVVVGGRAQKWSKSLINAMNVYSLFHIRCPKASRLIL